MSAMEIEGETTMLKISHKRAQRNHKGQQSCPDKRFPKLPSGTRECIELIVTPFIPRLQKITMRHRIGIWLRVALVAGTILLAAITYNHSTSYVRGAHEDQYSLWMAVLKGFNGQVYYVGSEGDFAYFRAGDLIRSRFKARSSKVRLPFTFPLTDGKSYQVTLAIIPEY